MATFSQSSDNGRMTGKLDHAIAEAEAESRKKDHENDLRVRLREAIDEQFPALWAGLRVAIKAACEARRGHLHFAVCPNTEVVVERIDDGKHSMLRLTQRPMSGLIAFTCGQFSGYCTLKLNDQNIAVLCDQEGRPFSTVEDAAEELLSLLFS
jgi:hypothetical protein